MLLRVLPWLKIPARNPRLFSLRLSFLPRLKIPARNPRLFSLRLLNRLLRQRLNYSAQYRNPLNVMPSLLPLLCQRLEITDPHFPNPRLCPHESLLRLVKRVSPKHRSALLNVVHLAHQ